MKIITYIAAVEHMSGMDLHAAASEEALNAKLAAYCRSHWETISWKGEARPEIPETDEATIALYFDDHEDDCLTTGVDSVDVKFHLVVEIFGKRPAGSLHQSLESARSCALDIAMESFWDPDTDEAAARAAFERKLDEAGSVCYGDHVVHLLPILP